jgi:hypothetical protein
VVGSSCGGVKPTGASFTGVSVAEPSAAAAMVNLDLVALGVLEKDKADGCFHGAARRLPEFGVERAGERREAWVAMAMREERERERERGCVRRM